MKTRQFPVRDVVLATPRALLLTLDTGGVRFEFAAGQAALVGLASVAARKPYSIASSPEEVRRSGSLSFLVETGPDAQARPNLAGVGPGSLVAVGGPLGGFALPRRLPVDLLFIAGGTGIAPLRAMIMSALSQPSPPTITLVYSARTPGDFGFANELRRLSRQGRIRLCMTVTRDAGAGWRGRRGRIRQAWIDTFVRRRDPLCFVCGPDAFVGRMIDMLREAGVPERRIRRERYD